MEPISVDSALDLYIEACNIYESEERAKYATDTYKRTIALLVRNKRYCDIQKTVETGQDLKKSFDDRHGVLTDIINFPLQPPPLLSHQIRQGHRDFDASWKYPK